MIRFFLLLTVLSSSCYHPSKKVFQAQQWEPYVTGEMIYPCYANADTLIVRDAKGLNEAIKFAASDGEIDSVLHLYCCNFSTAIITHPTQYHFNVDQTGYDIYTEDMKFVGRLNYGTSKSLDSLIDADNE